MYKKRVNPEAVKMAPEASRGGTNSRRICKEYPRCTPIQQRYNEIKKSAFPIPGNALFLISPMKVYKQITDAKMNKTG